MHAFRFIGFFVFIFHIIRTGCFSSVARSFVCSLAHKYTHWIHRHIQLLSILQAIKIPPAHIAYSVRS